MQKAVSLRVDVLGRSARLWKGQRFPLGLSKYPVINLCALALLCVIASMNHKALVAPVAWALMINN
jgi:hypothetical protein